MSEERKSVKEFSNLIDVKEEKGQKTTGKYLGSYIYTSKTKKDKDGKPKQFLVHKIDITDSEGTKECQFFGSGQLDSLLRDKVKIGQTIDIIYEGMEEIDHPEFGKTESHQFDVLA